MFEVGTEPDPRFSFSNERTLLSWVRTGLALAAAGVVLDNLVLNDFDARLRTSLAVVLLSAASICSIGGYFRWMSSERALRTGRPLPAPVLAGLLALGTGLLGVIGIVAVLTHA